MGLYRHRPETQLCAYLPLATVLPKDTATDVNSSG